MACYAMYQVEARAAAEELAAAGMTEEEIAQLAAEVRLAREKAKADSFSSGQTKAQQDRAVDAAETKARKRFAEEYHAKLHGMMEDIKVMGAGLELDLPHGHG